KPTPDKRLRNRTVFFITKLLVVFLKNRTCSKSNRVLKHARLSNPTGLIQIKMMCTTFPYQLVVMGNNKNRFAAFRHFTEMS
ncbi:MAG: hypothetical protein LBH57_08590, partial [Treponema sp.]|nr:hypothetical protein [Treponema sp.]